MFYFCFVVLLSYFVLHLDCGIAILQFDISSNYIMYTNGKLYKDLCATS